MAVLQGRRVSALRKNFLVNEDYDRDPFNTSQKDFELEAAEDKTSVTDRNEQLFNHLITEDSGLRLVSSTPKVFAAINENDFNEDFYLSEEELDSYVDGFVEAIKSKADNIFTGLIDSDTNQVDLIDSALDDIDIKLSLYRSFKSLYNKWVSNSEVSGNLASGYFFNNYGQNDNRTLFDHFKFINRANQDIGGIAVIDVSYLSNLSSTKNGQGPTQTLYQSLTNLLSKNKFDFWPLPSNTDLSTSSQSDEDIKDIFRPLDFYTEKPVGPTFNCVYVGGSSRTVNDLGGGEEYSCLTKETNFNYKSDSFDLTEETDWPEEFKQDNEGLIVFKVKYGNESQNHFSSIELDQAEFRETQESLLIIDALTNPESGSSPSQIGKGNNIFDLYLTRSYNCKVTGLGNMSIQPLMYFKLENVPMFRGTYLIKDVKHTIGAHNIKTEFTGMRQNRVTVPLVTDALSILDLTLSNVALDDETTSLADRLTNQSGTYTLSLDNKNYPVVPGGKCTNAKSKKECESCLGTEYTTYINGFDTPQTFSGQEIKPYKKSSKVTIKKDIEEKILPIINSNSYKTNYTKGHRMFAIVWAIKEGYKPGSRSYRTNNPGNIGNTDSGANKEIATLQEGMDLLMDYIKEASEGGTKYGNSWSFGEKKISPNWSREIAKNPTNYKRGNGCLPGYQGTYNGQLGYFTKKYATFSRVSNGSIGRLLTIFELNGLTGLNGNTTLKELLAFNDDSEIKFS